MIDQSVPIRVRTADPRRLLLLCIGYASFAAGLIGMFLPVLPTTVFWIVAALCFAKSSPAMYWRIVNRPGVGPVINDFVRRGVIRPRSKMIAIAGMGAASLVILFTVDGIVLTGVAIAGIASGALYVVTRPSR